MSPLFASADPVNLYQFEPSARAPGPLPEGASRVSSPSVRYDSGYPSPASPSGGSIEEPYEPSMNSRPTSLSRSEDLRSQAVFIHNEPPPETRRHAARRSRSGPTSDRRVDHANLDASLAGQLGWAAGTFPHRETQAPRIYSGQTSNVSRNVDHESRAFEGALGIIGLNYHGYSDPNRSHRNSRDNGAYPTSDHGSGAFEALQAAHEALSPGRGAPGAPRLLARTLSPEGRPLSVTGSVISQASTWATISTNSPMSVSSVGLPLTGLPGGALAPSRRSSLSMSSFGSPRLSLSSMFSSVQLSVPEVDEGPEMLPINRTSSDETERAEYLSPNIHRRRSHEPSSAPSRRQSGQLGALPNQGQTAPNLISIMPTPAPSGHDSQRVTVASPPPTPNLRHRSYPGGFSVEQSMPSPPNRNFTNSLGLLNHLLDN